MATIVSAQQRPVDSRTSLEGDSMARSVTRQVLTAIAGIVALAVLYFLATAQAVTIIDAKGIDTEMERARTALGQTIILDTEALAAIEEAYGLAGLRLARPERVAPAEISLATGRPDGRVLAWTPRRFGSETFVSIAPFRMTAGLMLMIVIGFVLHRLHSLARHLDRRLTAARSQALEDVLTGVSSRLGFNEALAEQLQQLDDGGAGAALLLLDLDGFKEVNDRLGHLAGDQMLREMARRIRSYARPEDIVARLGGDEFAIIKRSGHATEELAEFATDLVHLLSAPCAIDGRVASVGVSIGIARVPEHAREAEELVSAADMALYRAKAQNGGCFEFAMPRPYPQLATSRPAA